MGSGKHKTITLTKLDDTSHYCLWRVATEATFEVHNILNTVLGMELKPTSMSEANLKSIDTNLSTQIADWEYHHKLAREALFTALKPPQLICRSPTICP